MATSNSLRTACMFNKNPNYILRESDKNMGWALNTLKWYKDEYKRQLNSEFYYKIGKLEMVGRGFNNQL